MPRRPISLVLLVLAGCSAEAGPTGPQGPAGPQGPQGPSGTASISAVSPLSLYVDHQTTLTVSGSATNWGSAAALDLGSGISVASMVVASPSAIVAEVVADTTAELGSRSISVTEGDQTLTFDDAFTVESPLLLEAFVGTFVPGATVRATVRQMDPSTPFETPAEITLEESDVMGSVLTETSATVSATWDVPFNTEPGRHTIRVTTPGPGGTITSRLLPSLDLPAPIVTDLPIATATPLGVDDEEGTVVVRIVPPAGKLVTVTIDNVSPGSFAPFPMNLISPDSAFDRGLQDSFYAAADATWHLAIQTPPGGPYTFEVTADTTNVVVAPMGSAGPGLFSAAGEISPPDEIDFFSFPAAAGDNITIAFDAGSTDPCSAIDAVVEVAGPDGSGYAWGQLVGCTGVFVGVAETTGTYYVRVESTDQISFDYTLLAQTN